MKKEYGFTVNDKGQIPREVSESLRDFFYSRRNKFIQLTAKDKRGTKSQQQLAYWFALIVPLFSKHTGYDEKEIHRILKYRAGYVETSEIDGKEITEIKSFTDASKMDMMAIIEETKKWAEYLNLNIPEPNINWKEEKTLKLQKKI